MKDLEWVELVMHPSDSDLPPIGTPKLRWKDELLTFPTSGPFTLSMGEDRLATLTISFPVRVVVEPEP